MKKQWIVISLWFILVVGRHCQDAELLPAKLINVCELLCLTSRPQFVKRVFLRWWLREYLRCASGFLSQHEQWELPFPLTLQAVLRHLRTILPSSSAEILILSFLTCSSLWVGEGRKCSKFGSEGWKWRQWNWQSSCARHYQHVHDFWTHWV